VCDIYFHVGLHKTGTTFLQRNVFPYLRGVDFYCNDLRPFIFGQRIVGKTLVSDESLSGVPYLSNVDNRVELLDHIKSFYPDAKIIVFTRCNPFWVRSLYSTYVKDGFTFTYDEWLNNVFNTGFLNQKDYVLEIKKRFKDVFVCSYAVFQNDNDTCIRSLCDFMGVTVPVYDKQIVGRKLNRNVLRIVRLLNFFPVKLGWFFYLLSRFKFRNYVKKFFLECYGFELLLWFFLLLFIGGFVI